MKKIVSILGLLGCFFLTGCDSTDALPNGYIQTTEEGSSTLVLKGYESTSAGFSVFQPTGYDKPFYIKEKKFYGEAYRFVKSDAQELEKMPVRPTNAGWQESADITAGATYWVRYAAPTVFQFLKVRVAYIDGNNVGIEYLATADREDWNVNANVGYANSTTGYEIPLINSSNYYVDHFVSWNGKKILNYAFEWDTPKKHAAWVAFSFDKITGQQNVTRTDAWDLDPKLPSDMQTSYDNHRGNGFDRGHICASADRVYSTEANQQTFYYSNMSPQLASFNQAFWAGFEGLVQKWGYSCASETPVYDKVYVVKGGTTNQLLHNYVDATGKQLTDDKGFTVVGGLACPVYYYMAILSEKDGVYHAIGFIMSHKDYGTKKPSADVMKTYAVSISELQGRIGKDLFCNLPDSIEVEVERAYDLKDWSW